MAVVSKIDIKNASITREKLLKLLEEVSREKTLIAPIRNDRLGDVNFLPVSDCAEICFDYDNTTTSPKEFFFPQCECMFTFSGVSNDSIEVPDISEEIVLFGVRSCDVKGIELMDKFYERKFEDNYYLSKRRKSVLISVGCSELNEQCFAPRRGQDRCWKRVLTFSLSARAAIMRCRSAQKRVWSCLRDTMVFSGRRSELMLSSCLRRRRNQS